MKAQTIETEDLFRERPTLPTGMEEECRLWIVQNLRRLIEMGMRKTSARSTSKLERLKWANTVASQMKVLNDVLNYIQLQRVHTWIKEAEERVKEQTYP